MSTVDHIEQQRQWHFNKKDLLRTPSIKQSNLTYAEEWELRYKGTSFIYQVVRSLRVDQVVASTACALFHRFYMRRSIKMDHYYDIAGSCIFIACKIEERKLRLSVVAHSCAMVGVRESLSSEDPKVQKWENTIRKLEPVVLEYTCFDMNIMHPYPCLEEYLSRLKLSVKAGKMAWAFINDNYRTTLCLLFDPKTIAISALYFACQILALDGSTEIEKISNDFAYKIGVDIKAIEDCVLEMIKYYEIQRTKERDLEVSNLSLDSNDESENAG